MSKTPSFDIVRNLLLPTVLGLLAGVSGGLYAASILTPEVPTGQQLPYGRPSSSVTAPLPEAEIADQLGKLDLPLFPRKSARNGTVSDRLIMPSETVGAAVALTSDGWLVSAQSAVKNGVLVGVNGRLVEPKTIVYDARTGLAFLKIDAGSLSVAGFEETDLLKPGTPLFADDADGQFAVASFSGFSLSHTPQPSDEFSRVYELDRKFDGRAAGGAVMTAGGNLAGILVQPASADVKRGVFVPIHLLAPILPDAFRNQPLARASLGVRYIGLEGAVFAGGPVAAAKGALLASSAKDGSPAVEKGGAASLAGLKEGDIIVRVDDADMAGGRDLAEVISEYPPGSKIKIEVLRGSERKVFDVTLR